MSDTGPDLSFDKASYASSPSGAGAGGGEGASIPCNQCKRPLGQQYWKLQKFLLCDGCKEGVSASLAQSQSSFAKALVQGGLVALACGVGYAVFVGLTNIQFALVTIGIGFVVAKVVRKASNGLSGRKFQVLAVALTYVASTMGYAPAILHAMTGAADKLNVAVPVSAYVRGFWIMLEAPFLEATEAPLGLLIVGFGLWEAWKLSRGVNVVIEGPFRVAPAAPVTPGAPAA